MSLPLNAKDTFMFKHSFLFYLREITSELSCDIIFLIIFMFLFFSMRRTLTTPVELIKCLKSIKEHAFAASDYPVVITLEDHLTPDLQAKVAEVSVLFSCSPRSSFLLL